jgi:hypothetical protein
MHELSNIVLGIRLFNRAIDKGGVGLSTFEELYEMMSTGNELENNVTRLLELLINEFENYTHFLKISKKWLEIQQDKHSAEQIIEK